MSTKQGSWYSFGNYCVLPLVVCIIACPLGCSKEQPTSTSTTKDEAAATAPGNQKDVTAQLGKATGDVSDLLSRKSVSQEELEQLGTQFAADWETMMDKFVAQYESAPQDQKDAILDRYIDMEMQSRKKWDKQYTVSQKAGTAPSDDEIARRKYAMFVGKDSGERKSRSESISPDRVVKQAAFYRAVEQRASSRGINMRSAGG